MRPFFFILALLALFAAPHTARAAAPDEAERLYQAYGGAVYQVEVIDMTSEKKNVLGSGFQITPGGLIATNYHVIAGALQHPSRNRVEYVSNKGATGALTIEDVDVVHDLALVRMQKPGKEWLKLGTSGLPKGTDLYSIGNPHDLGFTIVPGTFNGLSHDSFIDDIHFSGALNPGMSGGPAIGYDGAVAGVNVATAGNGIGFLVPVEPLKALLARARKMMPPRYDFVAHADARLQNQLLASQNHNISELLANKNWESVPFGPVRVPGHINKALTCWGGMDSKESDPFTAYFSICATQDRLF
ncbi:MAG: S1C family serine protease, partial [Alphaproteobacteria bacterium]|nr:S1C family serine protease [Alphaproteobacteria bacterium]